MACYKPLTAFQGEGEVRFSEFRDSREIQLPCGRCIGCRLDRAKDWTVRCVHESQLYEQSAFVTLTYSDANLPTYGSLHYPDFQRFMRRLRKSYGKVRFFMCGEYGDLTGRPHYHALLFGYWPSDRVPDLAIGDNPFWSSPSLTRLWGKGRVNFGLVTPETAMYCASYTVKKITGDRAHDHYSRVQSDTGEIVQIEPELARMSLKPGIGARWALMYGRTDVCGHDRVILNGKAYRPPRYYDALLDQGILEGLKHDRYLKNLPRRKDQTDERLAVRERVQLARLLQREKNL